MGQEDSKEWLKDAKEAWVQGQVAIPVKVEVIEVFFEKRLVKIKTKFQEGFIEIEKLYRTEEECPSR